MNSIRLVSRAKINIALDVLDLRPDGYHNLDMLMQTVRLCDVLTMKKVDKYPLKLVSNIPWLPVDDRNLVTRAVGHFQKEYGLPDGLFVELKKRIPVGAGLAGGSGNCAAAILGMNALYSLKLSLKELMEIGALFGSDVPFCMAGGTVHATGRGEAITAMDPLPARPLVIVKPPFSLSSAAVFKAYDEVNAPAGLIDERRERMRKILEAAAKGDYLRTAGLSFNVLEDACADRYPEIGEIKKAMLDSGAAGAAMSGSGPSVVGYYAARHDALRAIRTIKYKFPHINEIFYTETCR